VSDLVKCTACKKKVSINAESCPHCGEPVDKEKHLKEKKDGNIFGAIIIIVFLVFVFTGKSKEEKDAERLAALQEKVVKIPASDIYRNMETYKEMTDLNPENKKYKKKYNYYKKKVDEVERKIGKNPGYGVPFLVRMMWEKNLNDPSSLSDEECKHLGHTKEGWVYKCSYRANNMLGGKIKKTETYLINKKGVFLVK